MLTDYHRDPRRNIPTLTLRNVGIFILTTPLDLSRKKFLDSRCIQKETFSSPFDRTPTEKSFWKKVLAHEAPQGWSIYKNDVVLLKRWRLLVWTPTTLHNLWQCSNLQ